MVFESYSLVILLRSFMMGSTLAGPVPIIVGGAMAVPMTYCFDMVVRGLYFSPLSLGKYQVFPENLHTLCSEKLRLLPPCKDLLPPMLSRDFTLFACAHVE